MKTLRERLFSGLIIDQETGCLLWSRSLAGEGYAQISDNGRDRYIHRLMYEMFVGPIPAGLEIDHLCRVRHCASPAHLEAVTASVNVLRGLVPQNNRARRKGSDASCPHGHLLDEANTRIYAGRRHCRACNRARMAERRRKHREN